MEDLEKELILKLHDKIDEIKTDLIDVKITLTLQEKNLEDHMRRTLATEGRQELIENEVRPILQGMGFFKTFAKLVVATAGIVYSIFKFFH